jgi:hypothetical protein
MVGSERCALSVWDIDCWQRVMGWQIGIDIRSYSQAILASAEGGIRAPPCEQPLLSLCSICDRQPLHPPALALAHVAQQQPPPVMQFGVWGLGLRVWGLEVRVCVGAWTRVCLGACTTRVWVCLGACTCRHKLAARA